MRKVNYDAIKDIKPLVPEFNVVEAKVKLEKVIADEHYNLAMNFSEEEAEAVLRALLKKYPGLYIKLISKKYVKNLATLEAMHTFMESWE